MIARRRFLGVAAVAPSLVASRSGFSALAVSASLGSIKARQVGEGRSCIQVTKRVAAERIAGYQRRPMDHRSDGGQQGVSGRLRRWPGVAIL